MAIELRLALFLGALLAMVYFLYQIRKSRLQIAYTISWTILSGMLLLLSIFPGIATWASARLGVESPANLVYLVVIAILLLKLFTTTLKLSNMDRQITDLTQYIAIQQQARERENPPPAEEPENQP